MKNKFIVIILIFMLLLAIFTVNSYGYKYSSFEDLSSDEMKEKVTDYYLYLKDKDIDITLFKNFFVARTFCAFLTDDTKINYYGYDLQSTNINACVVVYFNKDTLKPTGYTNNLDSHCTGAYGNQMEVCYSSDVVYTTISLYGGTSANVDFFYPAPQGITGVLVEETTKAEIMKQIKTMIVGFLKYLMVFLVSVIAFYKGWKFLSTQLRKS